MNAHQVTLRHFDDLQHLPLVTIIEHRCNLFYPPVKFLHHLHTSRGTISNSLGGGCSGRSEAQYYMHGHL